ncbi:hypothetical protein IE53DRAFT_392994, partial [Violaceomyces palustris]
MAAARREALEKQVVASVTHDLLTKTVNLCIPMVAGQVIVFLEALRTIPAEVRLINRINERKKMNLAEIMFFLYCAIVSYTLDVILESTKIPTSSKQCKDMGLAMAFFRMLCSTLVVSTIAWRTLIIFRNKAKVKYILIAAVSAHFALAMITMVRNVRFDFLHPGGYCDGSQAYNVARQKFKWYQASSVWFVFYNIVLDASMTLATCIRLWKTARGPMGFARISRIIFYNNIHYALCVITLQVVELSLELALGHKLPNMYPASVAIQVVSALSLLISEQDAV